PAVVGLVGQKVRTGAGSASSGAAGASGPPSGPRRANRASSQKVAAPSTAKATVKKEKDASAIAGLRSVIASAVVRWPRTTQGWRPVSRKTHPPMLAA